MNASRPGGLAPRLGGLVALLTLVAFWAAAFAVVTLARLWASLYADMGGALPIPAMAVMDAVRHHVPWGIALAATGLVLYLTLQRSHRLLMACALLAATGLIVLALAAVSLALPLSKCGVIWPDWPGPDCATPFTRVE